MVKPKLDNRGQGAIENAVTAIVLIFVGAIGLLVLSQIVPVILDNYIAPAIENRTFGSIAILLYELWLPIFVAIIIFLVLLLATNRRQPQQ